MVNEFRDSFQWLLGLEGRAQITQNRPWRVKTALFSRLLMFLIACLPALTWAKAASATPTQYRHHVIFLIDTSGSVYRQGGFNVLKSAIRQDLGSILSDPARHGFGEIPDGIYDPGQDLSTAMGFGLLKEKPVFGPQYGEAGFLRVLWFQESEYTYRDLAAGLPTSSRYFTAFNAAFGSAVRQVKYELSARGLEPRAFGRTFLVMVTDAQTNTAKGSAAELMEIHGAALRLLPESKRPALASVLNADRKEANAAFQQLGAYYALLPPEDLESLAGVSLSSSNLLVFIQELKPHRRVTIDGLLAQRPNRRTELTRRSDGLYEASLRLVLNDRPDGVSNTTYELLRAEYQAPGAVAFEELSGWGSTPGGQPLIDLPLVELDRSAASSDSAHFRLTFVRQDPVYGQAIRQFEDTIRFHTEPSATIAGVVPVTNEMLALLPGFSQGQVANILSWVFFIALLLLLAFLLAPRAWADMELLKSGASGQAAIPVDFNLMKRGSLGAYPLILRTLHFNNIAQRLPLRFQGHPVRFERKFDADVRLEFKPPETVVADEQEVLGVSTSMDSNKTFRKLTHNSEQVVGLKPGAIRDYVGDWHEPVECRLVVRADQLRRPPWKLFARHRRALTPATHEFALQFFPEVAAARARLMAGVAPGATGDVAQRKPKADVRISQWLALPHLRKNADERKTAPAELNLEAGSTATRVCSIPCDARLELFMYRADQTEVLKDAVELDADGVAIGGGFKLDWVQPAGTAPYWRVSGIAFNPGRPWPVSLPLRLNFEKIPLPPIAGDDYIVEAQLFPVDGQSWPTVTAYHGLQIGPDPRAADLQLEFDAGMRPDADVPWQALDWRNDDVLNVQAAPVQWSVGGQKRGIMTILRLRVQNLARAGNGQVRLALLPGSTVEPAEMEDLALQPSYRDSRRDDLLEILAHGKRHSLADLKKRYIEVRIKNDTPELERPVQIDLRFDANAIVDMPKSRRSYPFRCVLPFQVEVQEQAGGQVEKERLQLSVDFEVVRYTGEHLLAIDFGTSAVVAAFEESRRNIERRDAENFSFATLDLQKRYRTVLEERDRKAVSEGKKDLGGSRNVIQEKKQPNFERDTRFLSSFLSWQKGEQIGTPDFVHLPCTLPALRREVERISLYLKGLILRGDEELPNPLAGIGAEEASAGDDGSQKILPVWKDEDGKPRTGPPPVDDVLISAYRNIVEVYVKEILATQGRSDYLNKLVFAHPNNFSLGHIQRLKRVLVRALGEEIAINLISESDAVAIFCSHPLQRFLPGVLKGRRQQNILVYDLGAGTLDVTFTRLEWGPEAEAFKLQKVEVLFQSGIAVAGNRLDEALARLIDAKIRHFQRVLAKHGVTLEYKDSIVDPDHFVPNEYLIRALRVKEAIHALKVELAKKAQGVAGAPNFTLHVPINSSPDLVESLVSLSGFRQSQKEILDQLDIRYPATRQDPNLYIPLKAREIYDNPAVKEWLSRVTDVVVADLAGALREMSIPPRIDALIISGRTTQFPPVLPSLENSIRKHLRIAPEKLHRPELSLEERKEAVALGSLYYGLLHREGVKFVNRRIWARYGLIYRVGIGRKFEEFFGFSTPVDVHQGDKVIETDEGQMVLFNRTREINRAGGRVDLAMTFSQDPQSDVQDTKLLEDKFTIIYTIGESELKGKDRVSIQLSINEKAELRLVIDPDGLPVDISDIGYRSTAYLPELEWPFQALEHPMPFSFEEPKIVAVGPDKGEPDESDKDSGHKDKPEA